MNLFIRSFGLLLSQSPLQFFPRDILVFHRRGLIQHLFAGFLLRKGEIGTGAFAEQFAVFAPNLHCYYRD